MSLFPFAEDKERAVFCGDIAIEMMAEFGISADEALGRVNRYFEEGKFIGKQGWLLYHEPPEYWADFIYFGEGSTMRAPEALPVPYE